MIIPGVNLIDELAKKITLKLADLQATFINEALVRHVPQYLIDLYTTDGEQVPGAYLYYEYVPPSHEKGQAFRIVVEYKSKQIGYAVFNSWLEKGRMIIEVSEINYNEQENTPKDKSV